MGGELSENYCFLARYNRWMNQRLYDAYDSSAMKSASGRAALLSARFTGRSIIWSWPTRSGCGDSPNAALTTASSSGCR